MKRIKGILLVCAVVCVSQTHAKEIVFYGTLLDTILETASGKDPVMKIYPVSGAKIYFETGCTEEVPSGKYFAQSGTDGRFSVKVNLPDACTYRRYMITAACTTMSQEAILNRFGIEDTAVIDSFYVNLSQMGVYASDSIRDPSYMHTLSWPRNSQYIAGDTIFFILTTKGLIDKPDTLRYPSCQTRIVLTTTKGSVVFDTGIGCYENQYIYIPKGMYAQTKWEFVIPRELEKKYSDFRENRTLELSYYVYTSAVRKTVSFTVVDSGIKTIDLTGVSQFKKNSNNIYPYSQINVNSRWLDLDVEKPGKYSVKFYTISGRLVRSVFQNKFFRTGRYTISLGAEFVKAKQTMMVQLWNENKKVAEKICIID